MSDTRVNRRLGAAIQRRRKATGLSQEAFADAVGMHRTYYGRVERGQSNLTLRLLVRVARGLGIKPSVLLADAGH